ncbi:MAG: radical SAM protein, partial [Candidatus Aenigmatarchaeota archaeon]
MITEKREEEGNLIFVLGDIIKAEIESKEYDRLSKSYEDWEIVSHFSKDLKQKITDRNLVYINQGSEIPLLGHIAFGLIDRGTNLIQVRPITGCNLKCIYCSV